MLVVAKLKKVSLKNLWDLCNLKKQLRRSKVADLSKTIATVSPDKSNVMFKIYVHDEFSVLYVLNQNL